VAVNSDASTKRLKGETRPVNLEDAVGHHHFLAALTRGRYRLFEFRFAHHAEAGLSLSYLANARKLGDRLIVAVNSDASTKRLKGETRPVKETTQSTASSAPSTIIRCSSGFTGRVSPFRRLVAGILPDLLVKGGDYKPEQIAGSEEVWANGGEVLVPLWRGNSETVIFRYLFVFS
jgi:bifunctional ADP-heptose synthase (sugar kinase/adenylyltransferase)